MRLAGCKKPCTRSNQGCCLSYKHPGTMTLLFPIGRGRSGSGYSRHDRSSDRPHRASIRSFSTQPCLLDDRQADRALSDQQGQLGLLLELMEHRNGLILTHTHRLTVLRPRTKEVRTPSWRCSCSKGGETQSASKTASRAGEGFNKARAYCWPGRLT